MAFGCGETADPPADVASLGAGQFESLPGNGYFGIVLAAVTDQGGQACVC